MIFTHRAGMPGLRMWKPSGTFVDLFATGSVGNVFVYGPRAFVTLFGKESRRRTRCGRRTDVRTRFPSADGVSLDERECAGKCGYRMRVRSHSIVESIWAGCMSELAELLELLYGAHARVRSVHGVLREWRDVELSERAIRHEAEQRERRDRFVGRARSMQIAFAPGPAGPAPPSVIETIVRFWLERPDRVREEHHSTHPYGRDGLVMVKRGELWWHFDPRSGAVSNEDEPDVGSGVGDLLEQLLDPIDLLAGRELELVGEETMFAGRRALEVHSRPRPSNNPLIHGFPSGAQEYRHLVDRDRGVLLRSAALFQEQEYAVTELSEITFDETFPEDTFVLQLPAGETFASPGAGRPFRHITIEEAVERAGFPLWVLPRLPEGQWRMLVVHVEPRERPPIQEMVHITYMREDAQHQLRVSESISGSESDAWATDQELETIERNGKLYRLLRGEPGRLGPPTTLFFERGSTSIQLSSPDLPLETLLDLADSLETVR
jgi:outer membrane lipoprotein-sorting protein